MNRMKRVIIGAMIAAGSVAQAERIAYEGFESSAYGDKASGIYKRNHSLRHAANVDVRGGAIVGFGVNNWHGNTELFKSSLKDGGLTSGSFGIENSGRAELTGPGGPLGVRMVGRRVNAVSDVRTLYMSGMLRTSALDTTASSYLDGCAMGFADSELGQEYNSGKFHGLLFGFDGNGKGADLVVWGGGKRKVVASNVSADVTYHVVVEIVFNPSGDESVKVWLNPTAATGPGDCITEFTGEYADNLSDFSFATLYVRSAGTGIMTFDELMLATEYSDVMPKPPSFLLGFLRPVLFEEFRMQSECKGERG